MTLSFQKMHGLGNDFVIFDGRQTPLSFTPAQIRLIADRRFGVGCDQVIVMEPTSNADVFMRIYNPDGSEAGACGNATRCVADIIFTENQKQNGVIETISGLLPYTHDAGAPPLITVDMGPARLDWAQIPLSQPCDTLHLPLDGDPVAVNMGNPHCVFICDNALDSPVDKEGVKIEHHPLFPQKTNVEYVSMQNTDHIRMRVWERGAGITLACGSGACAAAVAVIRRGLTGRTVRVTMDGGDVVIHWRESDGHVLMTGPVAYSFSGTISFP